MGEIQVPPYWKVIKLREVCLNKTLTNPLKTPERTFTYVDVSSVSNDSLKITDVKEILGKHAPSRARQVIYKNDVIFATVRPTLKRVALIPLELDGQMCSTGFCVLRANQEYLDSSYLYFYLLTNRINQKVEALQKGVPYPAINDSDLFGQDIFIPPLPEQKAIAHTLRTIQKAKETRQRELELERERKAALMQYLFTHGTRNEPRKQTEIGEMAESWEVVKLEKLLREPLKNGHSALASNSQEGVRTLTLTAVTQNKFSLENTKLTQANPDKVKNIWLEHGDILIERANTYEMVGLAALYEGENNFAIYPDLMIRIRVKEEKIYPKFLVEFLLDPVCRAYFKKNASGTASSMPKIDQGVIRRVNIPLPSYQEQMEIVEISRNCDRKISALEKEITLTNELFHAMLEQLMTGQISTQTLINKEN